MYYILIFEHVSEHLYEQFYDHLYYTNTLTDPVVTQWRRLLARSIWSHAVDVFVKVSVKMFVNVLVNMFVKVFANMFAEMFENNLKHQWPLGGS